MYALHVACGLSSKLIRYQAATNKGKQSWTSVADICDEISTHIDGGASDKVECSQTGGTRNPIGGSKTLLINLLHSWIKC